MREGASARAPRWEGLCWALISSERTRRTDRTMPTKRQATIRHRTALYEDATAIVDTEYGSNLSLDDIARRVASSRRQLQRAYSEIGRTTFREHLTEIRMRRASELLMARGLTIREVAYRVGYRQPAQFAKAFRRHHGMSPSDFRASRRMGAFGQNGAGPAQASAA